MGVRLPTEYQEVEYIESYGAECIQTDVVPSNTIGFDCTFYAKSSFSWTAGYFGCIFGGRFGSGSQDFQLTTYIPVSSYRQGSLRFGPTNPVQAGFERLVKQSVSLRNLIYTDAGGNEAEVQEYVWTDIRRPITLFLLNSNGSYTQGGSGCRIYVMRFYDGDNLIREYVPCYRKADGEIGMYELITGTFLANAGTGEFTAGGDVIDSISPWLVARRRALMKEPELYPVGTDIRSLYNAVFISGYEIDTNTGEYVEDRSRQASPVYMPISPKYTYWKRGTYPNRAYLNALAFYDKDKNYISYYGKMDYNDFVIPDIPANARYARIAIPSGLATDIKIIRTA